VILFCLLEYIKRIEIHSSWLTSLLSLDFRRGCHNNIFLSQREGEVKKQDKIFNITNEHSHYTLLFHRSIILCHGSLNIWQVESSMAAPLKMRTTTSASASSST
jgi:hypothetical protein